MYVIVASAVRTVVTMSSTRFLGSPAAKPSFGRTVPGMLSTVCDGWPRSCWRGAAPLPANFAAASASASAAYDGSGGVAAGAANIIGGNNIINGGSNGLNGLGHGQAGDSVADDLFLQQQLTGEVDDVPPSVLLDHDVRDWLCKGVAPPQPTSYGQDITRAEVLVDQARQDAELFHNLMWANLEKKGIAKPTSKPVFM
eukprot:m.122160 g.122160  ORF g.122160 m.122160 type:complete len:198 (+) comp16218_c1_seq2:4327-4920(+)